MLLSVACLQFSCKDFVEIDPPQSSLVQESIFKSDELAIAAVTGIYRGMAATSNSFASGGFNSISSVAGASADELIGSYNSILNEFYENQISPANSYNRSSLYPSPYKFIYTANAVLEGLSKSNGVTPPVKQQLEGEALFIRAFCYFYLVNMYGSIPLVVATDYRITERASREPIDNIYQQILKDLKAAELLLTDSYITTDRIRPNRSVVQALLARTYLYQKDWGNAEKYASLVISKTNTYSLVGLDAVFLKNSKEAIWQLMPAENTNSGDGNLFIPASVATPPVFVSLRKDFVDNAFDAKDNRKTSWVRSYTNTTGTYYYPFKYKIRSSTTVSEYSMVFRLAELYLIRAEARINQENIGLGIMDLNVIRQRPLSGINSNPIAPLSTTIPKSDALLAIERERRVELFSEWGHRWFDLKRNNRTNVLLSPIKPKWQITDNLYPIPIDEINLKPSINQNDGY